MTDDPLAKTPKTDAAKDSAQAPTRESQGARPAAPARENQSKSADAGDDDDSREHPAPAKSSPWVAVLGVLCAILLITVVVFSSKVSARDKTIVENKNRNDQVQAASTKLQSDVDDAKADSARLQKQLNEATAASDLLKADAEKTKATSADLQGRLDKARAQVTTFQTQAEEAKVASLKHQGEVEVAQAQTAVMQEQLNKARTDLADLKAQMADLQAKLDKAEAEVVRLQKPAGKK